jgi:hypothetical protein
MLAETVQFLKTHNTIICPNPECLIHKLQKTQIKREFCFRCHKPLDPKEFKMAAAQGFLPLPTDQAAKNPPPKPAHTPDEVDDFVKALNWGIRQVGTSDEEIAKSAAMSVARMTGIRTRARTPTRSDMEKLAKALYMSSPAKLIMTWEVSLGRDIPKHGT